MITTPPPANTNTPPTPISGSVWPMFERLRREYLEKDEAGRLSSSGQKYPGEDAYRAGRIASMPRSQRSRT